MKRFALMVLLVLMGCATPPGPKPSPLRLQADAAAREAVAATARRDWVVAHDAWRDALAAYQSIDDWPGQGRSRLGLATALVRQGRANEAVVLLYAMVDGAAFMPAQRAQVAYQIALIESSGDWLARARALCGERCAIAVQLDNLEARFALRAGLQDQAERLATRALQSGAKWAEEAHARRILAEVALLARDWPRARREIDVALRLDRELAEPVFLLDDYALLLQLARASGDAALENEARLRQESICRGLGEQACLAVGGVLR